MNLNKLLKPLFLTGVLLLVFTVIAPSAEAADLKIGAVNAVKLLDEAPQKDAALARLKSEFESRNKELVARKKMLQDLEEKFNRNSAIMSEAERESMERDIVSKNRDFKRDQEVFQEDYNIRRNEEFRKLQEEIAKAIITLAERERYDLVVYEGVIYASDKVDITSDVLKVLKSQHQ